jgi:hypothetical protein
VSTARRARTIERKAAKERQGERTDKHPGKLPEGSNGEALELIGRAVGKGRRTLEKAREVCDAAKADPGRFGKLKAEMDRSLPVSAIVSSHQSRMMAKAKTVMST